MLKYLRKHRSIGHVALLAIMFNVLVQVNCCIGAIEGAQASETSNVSGFWAEARASLCVHAETDAASEEHLAAFDKWAASMVPESSIDHSDHGNHDADTCECMPGVCDQSAGTISDLAELPNHQNQIASVSLPADDDIISKNSFALFSARGPPLSL